MLEGFEVDVGGFVSAEGVSQLLLLKLLLLKFNAGGCWKFVTAFFSDKMEVCQKGGGVSQKEATFALCRAFLICCCYIYIYILFFATFSSNFTSLYSSAAQPCYCYFCKRS